MKIKPAPPWRFFTGDDASRLAVSAYYGASRWADFRASEGERITPGMFFDMFMSEFLTVVRDDAKTGRRCRDWIDDMAEAEQNGTIDQHADNFHSSRQSVKDLPPPDNAADNRHSRGADNA